MKTSMTILHAKNIRENDKFANYITRDKTRKYRAHEYILFYSNFLEDSKACFIFENYLAIMQKINQKVFCKYMESSDLGLKSPSSD